MLRYIPIFSFLCLCFGTIAQPAFGPAFLQDEVASVRITIDPDSLAAVLNPDNWYTEREFPATFSYESSNLNQIVSQIGFRLRGNTSLNAAKKSFKVSFNTYTTDGTWQGLEKMNLNGSANDPSMIRTKLCWDALRESGLPAARTSFVKLYINDEFKGLYTNVEHIDEEFTQKYYDNLGTGNLYKCLYPATLKYLGSDPELYKLEANGRRSYELKTNDWNDDYKDLAILISILNQTSIAQLPCKLEAYFNVDQYLRYAALDVLLGNWDGYAYNQNNFYLYHNQNTGLFEFLPYDLDNTLGIDWLGQDWATKNIYTWTPANAERPLFKRLLQVPKYRARYSYYMRHYLETTLLPSHIETLSNTWLDLIDEFAFQDTYRTQDFGFTYTDFTESVDSAWGNQVKFGIVPYLTQRKASALSQADPATEIYAIEGGYVQNDFPISPQANIFVQASGPQLASVRWEMSTNGTDWTLNGTMLDTGISPDLVASDGVFSATLPTLPVADLIYYRFKVGEGANEVVWPCEGRKLFLTKSQLTLFINEVMSKNASTIADEDGKFEDWIELFNGGSSAISLDGKFLSDDPLIPMKWPLPDTTLEAGDFILFWADSDEEDSRMHTNFKLSASGEELRLYDSEKIVPHLIDRIFIPELADDISYGRTMDGGAPWITFSTSTPNATNEVTGIDESKSNGVFLYPNPTNQLIRLSKTIKHLELVDMTGKLVLSANNVFEVNVEGFPSGIYCVLMDDGMQRQTFKVVKE